MRRSNGFGVADFGHVVGLKKDNVFPIARISVVIVLSAHDYFLYKLQDLLFAGNGRGSVIGQSNNFLRTWPDL